MLIAHRVLKIVRNSGDNPNKPPLSLLGQSEPKIMCNLHKVTSLGSQEIIMCPILWGPGSFDNNRGDGKHTGEMYEGFYPHFCFSKMSLFQPYSSTHARSSHNFSAACCFPEGTLMGRLPMPLLCFCLWKEFCWQQLETSIYWSLWALLFLET